jgi:hypothetical protein
MILEYIYRVKSLGVFMENLKFLRIIAWVRSGKFILWRNLTKFLTEYLFSDSKISQGYLWKLEFKYFDIKLFYVTAIVLLAPEMYDCKVISPKMLDPRAFQNIHQSWKSNI